MFGRENISTLYNGQKKFVHKQPPQLGDYNYLLEKSNNFIPNNSINTDEIIIKIILIIII